MTSIGSKHYQSRKWIKGQTQISFWEQYELPSFAATGCVLVTVGVGSCNLDKIGIHLKFHVDVSITFKSKSTVRDLKVAYRNSTKGFVYFLLRETLSLEKRTPIHDWRSPNFWMWKKLHSILHLILPNWFGVYKHRSRRAPICSLRLGILMIFSCWLWSCCFMILKFGL